MAGGTAGGARRLDRVGHGQHRARLAVRGSSAKPRIGLFEAGTHHVVDIPDCAVHHPRIDETAARIIARLQNGNVYVNRSTIGAVVGTQPFGALRLAVRVDGREWSGRCRSISSSIGSAKLSRVAWPATSSCTRASNRLLPISPSLRS